MTTHRHHPSWLAISVACMLLAMAIAPFRAHALTLSPSRFEISGDPGQTIVREITLVNETDDAETFYPSYSNFEAQGDSGTPIFVDPKDDIGTWMNAGSPVTLKGGESKEVTITISIPQSAEAGGHFGAIFWATTPPTQGSTVSVGSRIGALVLLSVSGEIDESFGLVDFHTRGGQWLYRSLPVGFEYRFSNQGGDRVKPVGTVTVRSILGWRVAKLDANPAEGNVLPGTTRKFLPEWAKELTVEEDRTAADQPYSFGRALKEEWHNFAIGIFKAKVSMEFGTEEQRTTSKSIYFVVFPWELLIVVLPGVYLVFILLRLFLRRYNRSIIRKAQRHSGAL